MNTVSEQPEAGRGVCSRCHGVDGDCDALMSDDPTACPCRCHEPQAQEAVRAAGLYPLYNELIDLIGECAVTDEMSCGVCHAEEGDDHHDSCPIGIIEEWAHNNLARESPPTNAEAVRLLKAIVEVANDVGEKHGRIRRIRELDALLEQAEQFLAQHGGRGDE